LLEYDDSRSGSFEPLADALDDKVLVLGLISTKKPEDEPLELLCDRVRQAARYFPLEQLALSPQCGFASSRIGNRISADDQRRKLDLLARAAQTLWG
jgi:5-methyltetrahydropteroyltriglutamate--homocysteine methyltransferase